jgi:hypothetical protein
MHYEREDCRIPQTIAASVELPHFGPVEGRIPKLPSRPPIRDEILKRTEVAGYSNPA